MSIYTVHHFFVLGFTLLSLFLIAIIVTAIVIVMFYFISILNRSYLSFGELSCPDSPPHATEGVWRVSDQLHAYQLGLITTLVTLSL